MSYSEFTLETVERQFGITTQESVLFPKAQAAKVPDWPAERGSP